MEAHSMIIIVVVINQVVRSSSLDYHHHYHHGSTRLASSSLPSSSSPPPSGHEAGHHHHKFIINITIMEAHGPRRWVRQNAKENLPGQKTARHLDMLPTKANTCPTWYTSRNSLACPRSSLNISTAVISYPWQSITTFRTKRQTKQI